MRPGRTPTRKVRAVARHKTQSGKSQEGGRFASRPSLSLTKALGLIILIEGVALGLKAYDDRARDCPPNRLKPIAKRWPCLKMLAER